MNLSDSSSTSTTAFPCPHCNQPITGRFCANCGERRPRELKLSELAPGLFEQLLQFEYPLARALRQLLLAPAALIRAYWAGNRLHVTHPFKLCFWTATLYFAVLAGTGLYDKLVIAEADLLQLLPIVLGFSHYLLFVNLVPPALLLARFIKPRISGLAAYVALLYGFAMIQLVKLFVLPLAWWQADLARVLNHSLGPIYLSWLLWSLLSGRWWWRLLACLSVYLAYSIMQVATNSAVISLARIVLREV